MLLVENNKEKQIKKKRKRVPKELIYEMKNGGPIYYRDYKKVLVGEKALEEVMGSGKLQAFIIDIILRFLYSKLNLKKYSIFTNEAGYQWEAKTWRNLDIAIFEKENLICIWEKNPGFTWFWSEKGYIVYNKG